MTSIEIVVIVSLMIVTVSLLSVVSYARKAKKEAALALARENAQKEKIKQWWNSTTLTTGSDSSSSND